MITKKLAESGIETSDGEEWRQHSKTQWVSNCGRVVRVWVEGDIPLACKGRGMVYEMKPTVMGKPTRKYKMVTDGRREDKRVAGGRRYFTSVHRMVALVFIPNPLGKPEVHHRDNDSFNNRVENLEWVTHAENMAYTKGTREAGNKKMTAEKLVVAIRMTQEGFTQKEIGEVIGICQGNISDYLQKAGHGFYTRNGNRGSVATIKRVPTRWRSVAGVSRAALAAGPASI